MSEERDEFAGWTEDWSEGAEFWTAEALNKKAQFVARFRAAAQSEQARSGVPVLVTLAQAALESGWGQHAPRFNFFGIKAKASDPEPMRQLLRTREILNSPDHQFPVIISITQQPNGKYLYIIKDWFRAYDNPEAAFLAHGDFLRGNPRYSAAFNHIADAYRFAREVALAGYATDPNYADLITTIMREIEDAGEV